VPWRACCHQGGRPGEIRLKAAKFLDEGISLGPIPF